MKKEGTGGRQSSKPNKRLNKEMGGTAHKSFSDNAAAAILRWLAGRR